LQKILYFIQAEFLVVTGEECFTDTIEAWDFGPVIPVVYQQYKIYVGTSIPALFQQKVHHTITELDKQLIDNIVKECEQYSVADLTVITCSQDPWIQAYDQGSGTVITPEALKRFFAM